MSNERLTGDHNVNTGLTTGASETQKGIENWHARQNEFYLLLAGLVVIVIGGIGVVAIAAH